MKKWHVWHDDGRQTQVKAKDTQAAFDEAMEVLGEGNINKIAIEEIEKKPKPKSEQ